METEKRPCLSAYKISFPGCPKFGQSDLPPPIHKLMLARVTSIQKLGLEECSQLQPTSPEGRNSAKAAQ